MDMPDSIKAFFDAEQRGGPEALSAAFLEEAIVRDEGARREGLTAIREWWEAGKQKYQHTAMPIEMTGTGDAISVCAVVTGRFPGSPATLTYSFTLRDGGIAELEIQ
ncbi:nuclear transport factor 2 family protein [Alsobacter sp. SYSU BS001988]